MTATEQGSRNVSRLPFHTIAASSFSALLVLLLAGCGPHKVQTQNSGATPDTVPPGTTLVIGDPVTQEALILSGEIDKLPFKVTWANISGGPNTTQAFRAHALDLGAVADIPPIHANWTGVSSRIVATRFRRDPVAHPIYQLGIAPGAHIASLKDLRGKKIAYSAGQAQGALVLRILKKTGLSKSDVHLVELPSTTNVYANALASKLVDAAPLGVVIARRYLAAYAREGASVISHGLRDDPSYLFAPQSVLDDPAKAAALRIYIQYWARAQRWIDTHPPQWAKGYYGGVQGLSAADSQYVVAESGHVDIPASWNDVIARQQETIDLLAEENRQPRLDAASLFDRRYERVASDAFTGH
jgi:sulfonate transport system substrate-binding protein